MVEGLKNIARKFKQVTTSQEAQIYSIMRKAAEPIVTSAQSRVNSRTGNLRASIGFIERNRRYKNMVLIGPRTYGGWKGQHAYLVGKGFKIERYDGGVTIVPGNNFMGYALAQNAEAVKAQIEKDVFKLIEQQIKK